MEKLNIMEKMAGKIILLEIDGTVNSYTYTDFQNKLYSLIDKSPVCIDMSKVINLSSAGLGVLMTALEAGQEKGNNLLIMNPSEVVVMAIESTGFSDMFKKISSLSEIE